jgi:hypothetical protein
MFQYMETLGAAMGQPPPSLLFPTPPPATTLMSMNVLVCMFLPDIGHTTKNFSPYLTSQWSMNVLVCMSLP